MDKKVPPDVPDTEEDDGRIFPDDCKAKQDKHKVNECKTDTRKTDTPEREHNRKLRTYNHLFVYALIPSCFIVLILVNVFMCGFNDSTSKAQIFSLIQGVMMTGLGYIFGKDYPNNN